MIKAIKTWWIATPKAQRAGLMAIAAFLVAVLVMSFGVTIGAALAKVL